MDYTDKGLGTRVDTLIGSITLQCGILIAASCDMKNKGKRHGDPV